MRLHAHGGHKEAFYLQTTPILVCHLPGMAVGIEASPISTIRRCKYPRVALATSNAADLRKPLPVQQIAARRKTGNGAGGQGRAVLLATTELRIWVLPYPIGGAVAVGQCAKCHADRQANEGGDQKPHLSRSSIPTMGMRDLLDASWSNRD